MTDQATPARMAPSSLKPAYAALLFGAVGMGMSPLFVRFAAEAGVGPYASAFWRVFLALPFLWVWARFEEAGGPAKPTFGTPMIWAGVLFSGDLFFWHLSILKTTIANATFLSTTAPVWVLLVSVVVLKERVRPATLAGLALCLLGGSTLIGDTLSLAPERLLGDLFGLMTAVFFGLYFFGIKYARDRSGAGRSTFAASLVSSMILLVVALAAGDQLWPETLKGAAALLLMAMISQALGQGLLSVALGRLPTVFSALVIFLEAVAAAALGWIVLDEALSPLQWIGGGLILCGIFVARPTPGNTPKESE
jgi:drug/metabolite transporter (DMT)-like permease